MRAACGAGQASIGDVGADHAAVLVDQSERLGGDVEEMLRRAGKAALDISGRIR